MQDAGFPIQLKYAFILPVAYYDESSRYLFCLLPVADCLFITKVHVTSLPIAHCLLVIGLWSVVRIQCPS